MLLGATGLAACGEDVYPSREEAMILPANFILSVGDTSKLLMYSLQNGLIGERVEWTSDASLVVSVSDSGVVRALSPGRAIIRGTAADRRMLTSITNVDVK